MVGFQVNVNFYSVVIGEYFPKKQYCDQQRYEFCIEVVEEFVVRVIRFFDGDTGWFQYKRIPVKEICHICVCEVLAINKLIQRYISTARFEKNREITEPQITHFYKRIEL